MGSPTPPPRPPTPETVSRELCGAPKGPHVGPHKDGEIPWCAGFLPWDYWIGSETSFLVHPRPSVDPRVTEG